MPTESRPEMGGTLLLDQNQIFPLGGKRFKVTLNNFVPIARPSRRRRVFQMSALSTFDGRLCAYHGCNG